jgi:hypothetical protein
MSRRVSLEKLDFLLESQNRFNHITRAMDQALCSLRWMDDVGCSIEEALL